jgi:hypothetical protein
MELLLNLAWLLLALPAFWLWRGARSVPRGRKFSALQCLLALGCMLVVLFPVVSATDDLHAMRNEIEESPSSKRAIRQATQDKSSVWKCHSQPALAATASSLIVSDQRWQPLPTFALFAPASPAFRHSGRAPPFFLAV